MTNVKIASRIFAGAALALLTVGLTAWPAGAQQPTSVLEGNHPDAAADIATEGSAAPSRQLKMHLMLALHNRADLDKLLAAQQTPSSPQYHKWLTAKEFSEKFGPTEADIAKVTGWLKGQGFTVKSADKATRSVVFTSDVTTAEKAFGVKIAATADGITYANTTDPVVPADLALMIDSIAGLDNTLHSVPRVHRSTTLSASPDAIVNAQGPAFGPQDIYEFYDETPLLGIVDGTGTDCMAIVEDSNLDGPAADAFNTQFGLPAFTGGNFGVVLADGTDPGINGDAVETMVDANYSHAAAPGSNLAIYIGDPNNNISGDPIIDGLLAAVQDNVCNSISVSFAFCGGSKKLFRALDSVLAQAAGQGQAVFVASGDEGSAGIVFKKKAHGCVVAKHGKHISELAGSPNVTAIGGTMFNATFDGSGNDVGSVPESVWNDSIGASGGGRSKIFKKPAFQAGLIKKDKKRDIPDISLGASPNSPGFFFGGRDTSNAPTVVCCVGGTSIGAPVWAGIEQLISQVAVGRAGNINVGLYALGNAHDPGIRDVTSGNNGFNGVKGFDATVGYDKATGWGTPDIDLFVTDF
jgi:subtilase family serine protease